MNPRTVISAVLYNKAEYLEEAIDSILAQTDRDFVLLLLDDASTDATPEICRRYGERDDRVIVHRNPERIGMLENTRQAFDMATRLFPQARYFALGSDHDIWQPAWLESLVAELEADPEVVLAYPQSDRLSATGEVVSRVWSFDTAETADPRERFKEAFRGMIAGSMIYGLFRMDALRRVGTYRALLIPDRLLLTELALHGRYKQVQRVLWTRRFRGLASLDRQRAAFFLGRAPLYTRLPWWVVHTAAFGWSYVVEGKGEPTFSRREGLALTADYLEVSVRHRLWRRGRRARKQFDRLKRLISRPRRIRRIAKWVARGLLKRPRSRQAIIHTVIPALRTTALTLRAGSHNGNGDRPDSAQSVREPGRGIDAGEPARPHSS